MKRRRCVGSRGGCGRCPREGTYPVNLVARVRLEDESGDQPGALCRLERDADLAEKEVTTAGQGRGFARLPDADGKAVGVGAKVEPSAIARGIIVDGPEAVEPVLPAGFGKVEAGRAAEAPVGRAVWRERPVVSLAGLENAGNNGESGRGAGGASSGQLGPCIPYACLFEADRIWPGP